VGAAGSGGVGGLGLRKAAWHRTYHDAVAGTQAAVVAAAGGGGGVGAGGGGGIAGVAGGVGVLGCKHYKRKAALVAPCCGRVTTCR
jgi:hypothetical protein